MESLYREGYSYHWEALLAVAASSGSSSGLLLIPFGVALISASIVVSRVVRQQASGNRARPERENSEDIPLEDAPHAGDFGIVADNGGWWTFSLMGTRVLASAGVVGLSVPIVWKKAGGVVWQHHYSDEVLLYGLLLVANLYALVLASVALLNSEWRQSLVRHHIAVLFSEFVVYTYRNIWPLATYTKQPLDLQDEGNLLWVKLGLLCLSSVVIPVCIPTLYTPVDPKNSRGIFHPEQTASHLSFFTYGYITPIIAAAQKLEHLPASDLPSLADYDGAKVLLTRAYPYLNPTRFKQNQHHLGFSLIYYFAPAYIKSVLALTVHPLYMLAAPLAVNKLLLFLESRGKEEPTVRPWLWIALIFCAPIIGSMGFQYYCIVMTQAQAQANSILTQLIFEHSLRVRIKAEPPQEKPELSGEQGKTANATRTASSFIGRLTNLVTIDLGNLVNARDIAVMLWQLPIILGGSSIFLYTLLGWSALVGLVLMAVLLPIPGYLTALVQQYQREKMKKTDARTQAVTESMGVLRMVKMFGWERKIRERIDHRREEELRWVLKGKLVDLASNVINFIIPAISMLGHLRHRDLGREDKADTLDCFLGDDSFQHHARQPQARRPLGKVSLDRIHSFFQETELLDAFEEKSPSDPYYQTDAFDAAAIGFRNAKFLWSPDSSLASGSSTPSAQYALTIPGELRFVKGKINLIVGPTGSGKTSLLMALLGEMHFVPTHPDSAFNLPRDGGVALAVQESWVQNETIRDNILFNTPYEEKRYQKVLYQCALEQDLELFEAGDLTEVGERGLTLSGGQKARLTLARAIYSKAEIILLDDVLAALDVHTAAWVVDKCLAGDLVQGRTVLLVTHNTALTSRIADLVVSVGLDGVVTSRGNDVFSALRSEPTLKAELERDQEALEADEKVIDPHPADEDKKAAGKLILAEEIQEGNIGWKSIQMLFKALGGDHITLFIVLWFAASIFEYIVQSFNLWFLGYWSSQYESRPVDEVPVLKNLGIYAGLVGVIVASYMFKDLWWMFGVMRASRTIHDILVESILGTTLRWLDETPVSRIITRLTVDIDSVDGPLMRTTNALQNMLLVMIVDLISAVFFVPLFSLPGLFIALIGFWLGSMYMKAQLSVKREMSIAKAPMLAHFSAAMAGLVSLRAYGAEATYMEELRRRIDSHTKVSRMNFDLNRWINFRIDILGATFTASLAAYLTYGTDVSPANVGFSLNRAVQFCAMILWMVRVLNMFLVEANSWERIYAYTTIEQEPKSTEKGKPPAAWPTSGEIRVENLTARYSKACFATSPAVLHDLSFSIRAGERVGVVGRTGSGKSSLTLSLLRCIITEGVVYFDGLPTHEINLDALRSNITIIPQIPELLSGTLRYNLNPFDEYDDATLNSALLSSGLSTANGEQSEARLTLDSNIASGGINVSVGERQIIALARAIVRSSKLLILDEATSAIDHETDAIIQNTLRRELGSNVTVLTIAHRLQTIIDADRILVLDAGRIVEFASPAELLAKPKGIFKALVDESSDKARLYQAVAGQTKLSASSSSSAI